MTTSITINQAIAYNYLTTLEQLDIVKIVGTRTKTGGVKPLTSLKRDCIVYFVANIYKA